MSCVRFILFNLALLVVVGFSSQQQLKAVDYIPGMESVLRAIDDRYAPIFNWPGYGYGPVPDGFYMTTSNGTINQVAQEAVNNLLSASSIFFTSNSAFEGKSLSGYEGIPSLSQELSTSIPAFEATAYQKFKWCVRKLRKFRHFEGSPYPGEGRYWQMQDVTVRPWYEGLAPDVHDSTGWISVPEGSGIVPRFQSASINYEYRIEDGWQYFQAIKNQGASVESAKFKVPIKPGAKGASVKVFIALNQAGETAASGEIPIDGLMHRAVNGGGSGIVSTGYFPASGPKHAPFKPLQLMNGLRQSSNSIGFTYLGARAIISASFSSANVSPPICIPDPGTCCPKDVSKSSGNSTIHNVSRTYFHTATDFMGASSSGSGCSPCGGSAAPSEGSLPTFTIARTHRYADIGWHSSFGPGVFLGYDQHLKIDVTNNRIEYFTPTLTSAIPIEFDDISGTFVDKTYATIRNLTLKKANGTSTIVLSEAVQATVIHNDGKQSVFEIFPETDGVTDVLAGRLMSIIDRNDNRITLTYLDSNPLVGDALLNYDRQRLWRFGSVTDGYGKQATFTWTRSCGQWVIASVTTAGGAVINYDYDLNSLIGLNRVRFPDGSVSTLSTTWDVATKHQRLDIFDAGAEDIHRNKMVYLTTSRQITTGNLDTENQIPNRIWQVKNGAGEISYRNQFSSGNSGFGLDIYEGGGATIGVVKHLEYDEQGRLLVQTQASSFTLTTTGIEVNGYQPVAEFTPNTTSHVNEEKDTGTGERKVYVRNAAGSPTGVTYISATGEIRASESSQYNSNQQLLLQSDRLGRMTEYSYDNNGNRLSKIAAKDSSVQATWNWSYNNRGQPLTATDANGKITTYIYEENAASINYKRLIAVIEPADTVGGPQATTSFTYDVVGRLETVTDAENRVVTRTYDNRNRLQRITYHDATYEEWTYGTGINSNLMVNHRDRNGNNEVLGYDAAGRRTNVTTKNPASVVAGQSSWTYLDGKNEAVSETVNGDTTSYTFDTQMRQTAVTRAANTAKALTTRTAYRSDNRIDYTEDAYLRRTYHLYNFNNLPIRMVSELIPGGVTMPNGSLADRDLHLSTLPRLIVPNPSYVIEEMTYDVEGQLISRTDARGITEKSEWDEQGRMKAVIKAATNAMTEPPTVIANAERTEYGYDAQGNRISVLKPKSFIRDVNTGLFSYAASLYATSYSYTGRNLLASVTEASGSSDAATVFYTYTLTKKKLTESDPRNATWKTTYSYYACCNRLYQITDAAGKLTTYTYDAVGNVLTVRDPNNVGMTYTYDARHRALTATNTWGKITTYTYDDNLADGTGLSSTYAAQLSGLGFGTGADGSAVLVTNPLNEISLDIHDGVGRVVRRVDGNLNAATVTYDTVVEGLVQTGVSDALGNTTYRRQDAAGRDRVLVDALGMITTATFDANGNQLSLRDANLVGWTVADDTAAIPGYDLFNRLLKRTDTHGDATSMTYDLHGNVVTTVDALNKTMTCTYDFRDRKKTCTDRVAGLTQYSYDKANHLTKIQDADSAANGVTDYTYDSRGLLSKETFPAGKDGKRTVRTYTYDSGKRLSTRTITTTPVAVPALNEKTTYSYNTANLLTKRAYNDAKGDDTFGYDNAGRLTSAVSGRYGNTVNRYYNGNTPVEKGGRLTSEKLTVTGTNAGNWTVKYAYDAANRVTKLTYPTNDAITRGYNERNLLTSVKIGSANVATRTYDAGGRLATSALGNNLVETRSYRSDVNGVDNMLVSQALPGVTDYTYAYDANKRVTLETDALFPAQTQQFLGYDNENRLTNWKRGTNETQSWVLSKVGDWTSTTINGTAQTRTHSAVHEVTALGATPINYDLKGNLTLNQDGSLYNWDSENRLTSSTVVDATYGASDTVTYRYDALGRRVQKTVYGMVTTFIHAGAQVVHEFDAKIQLPATSATDDGNGTGTPPGGGILQGAGVTRFNYQPSLSPIPSGFFADKGSVFGLRSNGKSYGWLTTARTDTVIRNQHPLPQFDSFNQAWLNNTGSAGTWEIDLANGTYAVIVVMGDPASANQTNNLTIEGQAQTDPDPAVVTPPGYRRGDFDGYAVTANVTDGKLTLAIPATALNPKLCFIEIGPQGSSITQADRDRLATAITDAGDDTSLPPFPKVQPSPRLYVYGSYVDEPLMMKAGGQNYYYATNRLYSVAAISDQSGAVVERYKYDAYGKQGILAPNGVVAYKPSDYGQFHGFTGRYHDWETGLAYFRARYFDHNLGRFIGRDPLGYVDGMGLYGAYFIPNSLDPLGLFEIVWGSDWTEFQKRLIENLMNQLTFKIDEMKGKYEELLSGELAKCPKTYANIIKGVKELLNNMDKIKKGILDKDKRLAFKKSNPLTDEHLKDAWAYHTEYNGFWLNSVTFSTSFFDQLNQGHHERPISYDELLTQLQNTMMHELSHQYGTDDGESGNGWNDAHNYDNFMDLVNAESFGPYYLKAMIDRLIKKGSCKCE